MSDFKFLQNPFSKKWVILAPRRAKRPNEDNGVEPACPFCPGRESLEEEVFRIGGSPNDSHWKVRVIPNKFPFASIHEVVIHSPDHHKSFGELSIPQTEDIFRAYRNRFQVHQSSGQVIIFNNRGVFGGESLPHPHSQIAVVDNEVTIDCPPLALVPESGAKETEFFKIFAPSYSQWPDEVWISPKTSGRTFGEITDVEISDFSKSFYRLIQIMSVRHGEEFPYNFYIYPGGDWYLRLMPRSKGIGGFELATGIYVNTQDPAETQRFINEHFDTPDFEKIKDEHRANHAKGV